MDVPPASNRRRRRQRPVMLIPALLVLLVQLPHHMAAAEECGNCFGAGEPGQCCNSCEDIVAAYKKKRWGYKESDFGPCRDRDARLAKEKTDKDKKANNNGGNNGNSKKKPVVQNNKNNNNNNQKKATNTNKNNNNDASAAKKREEEIAAKLQRQVDAKRKREEGEALKKKADEAARQKEIAERVKREAEEAAKAKQQREEEEQRQKKEEAAKAAAERRAQQQERQHQLANERMAKKNNNNNSNSRGKDKSEINDNGDIGAEKNSAEEGTGQVLWVKSKIHDKIQDVRDHHPLVDRTASVLAQTAHAIDEAAHRALESEAGQATLHKAKDAYAKASEGAGSAAHKLADKVAPSASAKYVSESHHSLIGGFIVIVFGSIAALSACSCYLKRSQRDRRYPGIRKEKADLDYEGGDIEGGAVFRDGGDKQQPFQLYHEFEYKMRRRYQGSSYSYASADSPPQPTRTPPQSMQQSNTYTYRQHSYGKNGEPVTVTYSEEYKDKPISTKGKSGGGPSPRRRLLTTVLGVAAVGYVGMTYVMPADLTFGDLWLLTAEFVDAKLGNHGLVL